jgi:hypothetical protein
VRDLNEDLKWLSKSQSHSDLSDDYLKEIGNSTREDLQDNAPDLMYGITFVESTIAREWLERAIKAEGK